ncbi:acyl-CoA dehydrogenase family protein [Saccharopolyspora spinosa]|uniref:Alkylation response protein AidB-like acyl-CoA dehydrogenase n=1 Tax=Saccharopolyspora spinosa TaxID=60894 RepID=A0A2N3Y1P4_SACSN|nr:acyl-CoA dehydrogenase family protein [Saccharopolyspora spinosa]PKW16833.1 alkylation response protein AidB-like acyl-CoA dehydrogenase [Saccharopolyspora spinosa]
MNLDETPEEAGFRTTVRSWLADNITPNLPTEPSFADRLAADRKLGAAGYIGYTWPAEFGGGGAGPVYASILDEECARVGIPRSLAPSRFGADLLAPALIAHGSLEQLAEFLPRTRRADIVWCQGFSEPEAGSDLANVQSRLDDAGDHFRLSGAKIWTTQAHEAQWCFALVRSSRDAPRHHNLAFVLFDMQQPGVTIRPLRRLTGDAEFNELFFDQVRVERRHVVGGLHDGWKVAMTTMGAERSYGQLSRYRAYAEQLTAIAAMVRQYRGERRRVWEVELGMLAADLTGIRDSSYKITSLAAAGESVGVLPSVTKLWWSTTHQRLMDLGHEVAVETGGDLDFWLTEWLRSRAESIYAGTSQVQRNIIGERMLGLPR